jgi:copper homeostasis protein
VPLGIRNIIRLFELNEANRESGKLVILPGSGLKPSTLPSVLSVLAPMGLTEIHSSCGGWSEGVMHHRPEGMGMGVGGDGEWGIWQTRESIVIEMRKILDTSFWC